MRRCEVRDNDPAFTLTDTTLRSLSLNRVCEKWETCAVLNRTLF